MVLLHLFKIYGAILTYVNKHLNFNSVGTTWKPLHAPFLIWPWFYPGTEDNRKERKTEKWAGTTSSRYYIVYILTFSLPFQIHWGSTKVFHN